MDDTYIKTEHDESSPNYHDSQPVISTGDQKFPKIHRDEDVVSEKAPGGVVDADLEALSAVASEGPPHTIFTTGQKRFITFMVSWGGLFSSISANSMILFTLRTSMDQFLTLYDQSTYPP